MGIIKKVALALAVAGAMYVGARTGACNYAADRYLTEDKAEVVRTASERYVGTFEGIERRVKDVYEH